MVRGPRPSRKGTGGGRRGDADCGAEETRTPDVLLAKEVLYQLSYGPKNAPRFGRLAPLANDVSELRQTRTSRRSRLKATTWKSRRTRVGVSGLEPEASALSGQCSNQLS